MGVPTAGVQSPQSSSPAAKGAGVSPSTPAGSTMSVTSGQPTLGAPNTNSNTGMDLAPAGKGGGSVATAATPANTYRGPTPDPSTFTNLDASGNPVNSMRVPDQYSNTIDSMGGATGAMQNAGVGKGSAAGDSQGKGP